MHVVHTQVLLIIIIIVIVIIIITMFVYFKLHITYFEQNLPLNLLSRSTGAKGRVLIVVGGRKGSSSLASTELFDYPGWWLQASKFFSTSHLLTAGSSWRLVGSLPSPRFQLDQVGTNISIWFKGSFALK